MELLKGAKTFFINGERAYLNLIKVEENGDMVFEGWGGGLAAYIKFSPSFIPIIQWYYKIEGNALYSAPNLKYDNEGNILWAKHFKPFINDI